MQWKMISIIFIYFNQSFAKCIYSQLWLTQYNTTSREHKTGTNSTYNAAFVITTKHTRLPRKHKNIVTPVIFDRGKHSTAIWWSHSSTCSPLELPSSLRETLPHVNSSHLPLMDLTTTQPHADRNGRINIFPYNPPEVDPPKTRLLSNSLVGRHSSRCKNLNEFHSPNQ